jgi:hypothetical protein
MWSFEGCYIYLCLLYCTCALLPWACLNAPRALLPCRFRAFCTSITKRFDQSTYNRHFAGIPKAVLGRPWAGITGQKAEIAGKKYSPHLK